MAKPYDQEFKQRALRMLAEALPEHTSLHAASKHIGGLLGVSPDTVWVWHRQTQADLGERPEVTTDIAAENRRLMRENAELRKANEVLKAASIFFAQELDRPRTKGSGSSTCIVIVSGSSSSAVPCVRQSVDSSLRANIVQHKPGDPRQDSCVTSCSSQRFSGSTPRTTACTGYAKCMPC